MKNDLDEADFQILVALAAGKSQSEAGGWVSTPEFPAGLTDRTVRNRIAAKQAAYDRLRTKVAELLTREKREYEELTKQKYLEKLGNLRSKGLELKDKILTDATEGRGDLALGLKVAESVEERDFGKATQVQRVEGEVNHNLLVWKPQPVRALLQQELDIRDSDDLLKALPDGVLEAEVVQ